MDKKHFLMTEESFRETITFYNKNEIDQNVNFKLNTYLDKVLNPLFPYKYDFILNNKEQLVQLINKMAYKPSKKSIFKYLENKAISHGKFYFSYLFSKIRRSLSSMRSNYYSSMILPRKLKNNIIYESFSGKAFSDSPKKLYQYLSNQLKEYEHIVVVDNDKLKTELDNLNIKTVNKNTKRYFKLYSKSMVWISNTRLSPQIEKKSNQIYIQTWHGTPLKKLANDQTVVSIPGITLEEYLYSFKKETERWDYLISPSEIATSRFKSAFKLKEDQILTLGYPRNDDLINLNHKSYINELKKKHNIPFDKKVVLYAPTWRDNDREQIGQYNFNLKLDLEDFNSKLGNEYILIIRAHYLVSENLDLDKHNNIYDLSNANDINELFLMSDILITDYSSVYFDYANLKRPILFFAYDKEEYASDIRGFYTPYEEGIPGPIFTESEALIKYIENKEYDSLPYDENYIMFNKKYNYLDDGEATKRVGNEVTKIL
ncbi:CDP-glycerol glycerophosphotransferase family protein [Mammaliicoccus lentus]|uniref:CDP-glycerol glycerophosphotransferase family protein n=1 Tax=Mammaliicoccus lentus TaxID=42858 RepID=A0ABS6GTI7_MAMLE|nr:CDP-glycerol glycerophosphotransferase family protein [Mammaliicoccus lentus]MBU6112329.1 CDP-glycerol glycerophosphotransferase family protein [Mammaliicoccus lentus]